MSHQAQGRFRIINQRGLHARAASKLAELASSFACEVTLSGPDESGVSAKSVMGVLLLCGSKGTIVDVAAVGEGAEEAVAAIGELIGGKFGELE